MNVWLVGSGPMAVDYINVLNGLKTTFQVIGRGEESAKACENSTGCSVISGGVEQFLHRLPGVASHAIVAVGVEKLHEVTIQLLEYGVKNILVEKPAGMNTQEINNIVSKADELKANVLVAYNRRFYASVIKAQEIVEEDGGVTSFNFEFTEWSHQIEKISKAPGVKEQWFLANSTHVVDLAFFLGGKPQELSSFISGSLDWHPSGSVFSGAGKTKTGVLFSYQANWESAGRWSVEVLTNKHRLILRPMEKLQLQKRGTIQSDFVELDDQLDLSYKPGLFLQTKTFLDQDISSHCTIQEHLAMCTYYNQIAGEK